MTYYIFSLFLINDPLTFLLFLLEIKALFNPWYSFFAMSVSVFNYLPNDKYSNIFMVPAFSSKYFSVKIFLTARNLNLLTFPDDKVVNDKEHLMINLSSLSI